MVVVCDTDETKKVYAQVFQRFKFTIDRIVEAKQEIVSFIDFCRNSSEHKMIFEKMAYEDWCSALVKMEIHTKTLEMFLNAIMQGLKLFERLMLSAAGNESIKFLRISEEVVGLFTSVQLDTEDRMKRIKKISEEIRNHVTKDEI